MTAQSNMDAVTRIARWINDRANAQGWRGKRGNDACLEAWAGAIAGLFVGRNSDEVAKDADDQANHLAGVASLVVARAPLVETARLAARPVGQERAA